jgi:hypothetical protein
MGARRSSPPNYFVEGMFTAPGGINFGKFTQYIHHIGRGNTLLPSGSRVYLSNISAGQHQHQKKGAALVVPCVT